MVSRGLVMVSRGMMSRGLVRRGLVMVSRGLVMVRRGLVMMRRGMVSRGLVMVSRGMVRRGFSFQFIEPGSFLLQILLGLMHLLLQSYGLLLFHVLAVVQTPRVRFRAFCYPGW